jgi:hypothetical protein
MILKLISLILAEESPNEAMVTIEVIKNPSLLDYIKGYFYIIALVIIIIFIILRKIRIK